MRLVRYGRPGKEKPGLFDEEGRLRDLSGVIDDVDASVLSEKALRKLAKVDWKTLPVVRGNPRFGVPVKGVGKFIGIGMNYSDHAAEVGAPIPKEPIMFMKATSCLNGPDDPIQLPKGSKKTDWEVELGVVIGDAARNVSREAALDHVAGYLIVNDVSERAFQFDHGGQWVKGKGCDTFAPIGPWLVTRDEVPEPQDLAMWLEVNGRRYQDGNTRRMIFDVATLVSHISRYMTLLPGDVISTGTPPGVGLGQKPPVYLKPGDVMELGIDGLGAQCQRVVAAT